MRLLPKTMGTHEEMKGTLGSNPKGDDEHLLGQALTKLLPIVVSTHEEMMGKPC